MYWDNEKAEGAGGGIYPCIWREQVSEHTVDSCLAALRLFFRLYGEIMQESGCIQRPDGAL